MRKSLYIPVVIGTGREGRKTPIIAKFVTEQAKEFGFDAALFDVVDFATLVTSNNDEKQEEWKAIAEKADGFIIVVPEYNHSYPGELKLLLDKAYNEYNHKPVGLCTVAAGGIGGTRVAESMLPVFNAYKMIALRDAVYFTAIHSLLEENGTIKHESMAMYAERLQPMLTELQAYAHASETIRNELS